MHLPRSATMQISSHQMYAPVLLLVSLLLGCAALTDAKDQAACPVLPPSNAAHSSLSGHPPELGTKAQLVSQLLAAKEQTGKNFTQIAAACGLTNVFTANLFYNQAQLHPGATTDCLLLQVPGVAEFVPLMQRAPFRTFDKSNVQDPVLYRLQEALDQNGLALKSLVNELFGDGIMSAIDFFATVDKVVGANGEDRAVITLNGKFLPFVQQLTAKNTLCQGQCQPGQQVS